MSVTALKSLKHAVGGVNVVVKGRTDTVVVVMLGIVEQNKQRILLSYKKKEKPHD